MAVNLTACSQNVLGAMTDDRMWARHRSEYIRREYAHEARTEEEGRREVMEYAWVKGWSCCTSGRADMVDV